MAKDLVNPQSLVKRNITQEQFRVLERTLYRGASQEMILLCLDYCSAQGLDIFSHPVHIVPVYDAKQKKYIQDIWPGIHLYRARAARTGEYAGKSEPNFSPTTTETFGIGKEKVEITYPDSCTMTIYRSVGGQRCPFTTTVYWKEIFASRGKSGIPTFMWQKRPFGQLAKCVEAELLREAFPEAAAGATAEEMEGQAIDLDAADPPPRPTMPTQVDLADAVEDQVLDLKGKPVHDDQLQAAVLEQMAPETPPAATEPPDDGPYEFIGADGQEYATENLGEYVKWVSDELRATADPMAIVETNWEQIKTIPEPEQDYIKGLIPGDVAAKFF